mmetsp:Transcript_12666/g.29755  ORF Transcript_12666/g.29755 Transcript_12666/m.29755 type:complete len:213 (+) Transcript_12666:869-1507(+)
MQLPKKTRMQTPLQPRMPQQRQALLRPSLASQGQPASPLAAGAAAHSLQQRLGRRAQQWVHLCRPGPQAPGHLLGRRALRVGLAWDDPDCACRPFRCQHWAWGHFPCLACLAWQKAAASFLQRLACRSCCGHRRRPRRNHPPPHLPHPHPRHRHSGLVVMAEQQRRAPLQLLQQRHLPSGLPQGQVEEPPVSTPQHQLDRQMLRSAALQHPP